ncbi:MULTISPECIES: SLATT domain-containing protein [Photorhabdus]|uniref:SLATT domain-containing protein n=1 Tax=Photorhabdus TaxID=29487 RepID=UPI000CFA36DB|nr:SLATT domain-containing protein [Photorhabdus caribbeanensis]MBS9424124.1 SLATT domain-containing protein [Photorhabdus caribbeanensis]PQQ32996.1 hypothetical protein C6H64_00410 [Photorhabdus luminescens]
MAFENNIWWTRKARIQAEKRLLSNAFQSQLILFWYSFFGVAISIYYLKFSDNSDLAGVTWVIYSVLSLCMSGFITGLSFKERAGLIKECYETLNSLYQKAKKPNADIEKIAVEYEQVMGLCENHTDFDYYQALCIEHVISTKTLNSETGYKKDLDRSPTWYHWLNFIWGRIRRCLMLTFLYSLPILIFIVLQEFS